MAGLSKEVVLGTLNTTEAFTIINSTRGDALKLIREKNVMGAQVWHTWTTLWLGMFNLLGKHGGSRLQGTNLAHPAATQW